MTKQWDKYREIIIAEYKDQNKPLHEVQRFMAQRYGFRASTRAYRSRFDRWGVHKYSRRRRMRSLSLGRRDSTTSDSDARASPRQTPDREESDSQAATPVVETPNEMLPPRMGLAAPGLAFRSSLCLVKTDFPYTPVTPSQSPAVAQSPVFSPSLFGNGLAPFGSQDCYPSMSMPIYRPNPGRVLMMPADATESRRGSVPVAGIQVGYGYSLGILTGQE